MTISKTRPHLRLRFIVLAVLATVGMAVLLAPAGASPLAVQDAFAHGTCSNNMWGPSKTNAGRVNGSNAYVCTETHATTTGCAQIVLDTGSGAFTPVDEAACKSTPTSTSSGRAYVSAPCAGTGRYRVMGAGTATNQSGQVAHSGTDNTGGTWIQCAPTDPVNTAGPFEDIDALLATLL